MTLAETMSRGLVAAALVLLVACSTPAAAPEGSARPSLSPEAASGASSPTPAVPTPATTPPGTPGPVPDVALATSAEIETPQPAPDATPTATPQPGLWRIQGYVVDEDQRPLRGVCVVIGPRGCQPFSPHTDDRGHWFIDVAEGKTVFDFYFEMPGYNTVWLHLQPTGPAEYNVVLRPG